jgi:hypothetical protein
MDGATVTMSPWSTAWIEIPVIQIYFTYGRSHSMRTTQGMMSIEGKAR